ncbi:CorA family divalent cation transporter, partial [Bombilactobacillus bombi]|uniref:CorA family divalent cation transporter n=1 Tax=Bombilactobacillus bombi TaxID=1303590 RepID=UPI0015E5C551
MIKEYDLNTNLAVINANDATPEEQARLIKDFKITRETINYALDKFERPRVSFTELTHTYLMVITIPSFKEDLETMVQSVTIVANDVNVICFTNKYSQHVMGYILKFFKEKSRTNNIALQLFSYLIQEISGEFLNIIKRFY